MFVLSYFSLFIPSLGWRLVAGLIMDTAGHKGGSILQGLGCWPTVGLFLARDLHLQWMLLTYITKLHLPTVDLRRLK